MKTSDTTYRDLAVGLYPKMEYKPIEQCQPGDLVRLGWGGNSWAFIAKHQENESWLAVLLSDLPSQPSIGPAQQPPFYINLASDMRECVLCYGKNWRIEINQKIENVKLGTNCSYEYSGSLVVKGEQCLLLASPFDPRGFGSTACIDLASGELSEWPMGSVGIFLNWSLSLHMGGDLFEPLLSFPVEKQG